jgi:hypothetical protein
MIYFHIAIFLLVGSITVQAKGTARIELTDCSAAPSSAWAQLEGNWRAWDGYVLLCPVHSPDGRVSVYVVTISINLWEDDHVGAAAAPIPLGAVPKALIIGPDLETLGTMPTALGRGYPDRTMFEFSDWRQGFPLRIDAHHFHSPPTGDYDERPLIWNPSSRRYEVRLK